MPSPGPLLETLLRHLADCPADFLAEPRIGKKGAVEVAAVVADVIYALDPAAREAAPLTIKQIAYFQATSAEERNRLRMTLVMCWLLHAEWFQQQTLTAETVWQLLKTQPAALAAFTPADKFITDPDRREELARTCLKALDFLPARETETQAQDRLTTLSTAERQRVIQAAQAAEQRARDIRDAMAREAALEAQMKGMRE
jgi:hypothetical protein